MLADADYFNSRISKLEGSGDLGPCIVEVVKSKTIVAGPQQSQPRSPDKADMAPIDIAKTNDTNGEQEKT
jgi:hypothetical protein